MASGARRTSSWAFSSICHRRDRVPAEVWAPMAAKRAACSLGNDRASGPSALDTAEAWQWSSTSSMTTPGSAPKPHRARKPSSASLVLPAMTFSKRAMVWPRSARPSMSRTTAAVTVAPRSVWTMAWSSSDRPSRTEPSAARAIKARASVSIRAPSLAEIRSKCLTSTSGSTRRRSKRWVRDRIVTGTLRISVVAKMNLACGGGSSSVFSRALNAAVDSMCTSSMM